MGLPSMNITFKTVGNTITDRGNYGVAALILRDATVPSDPVVTMNTVDDIPATLSADNQELISLTFLGYKNTLTGKVAPPKKVIAYIQATTATDYVEPETYFETVDFDYIAVPAIADGDVTAFATWVKGLRDSKDKKVKTVLPNSASDHEAVINFVATTIKAGTDTYTAKEYCARIAGLLAGTPLVMSATYAPLPELTDCDHLTKADADTAINAGKLILINDGRQVKIARAVNSLTTTTADKGAEFKKIKIVDITDRIHDDIKETIEDNYVGKVQNDYDHKLLLVSAISNYFDSLELEGLLEKDANSVYIDVAAQEAYLNTQGVDTSEMSEEEIKEYNTGDKVFIASTISILDCMEDISLSISI